jgi:uncharacterized protein YcbK (DUF882 family)
MARDFYFKNWHDAEKQWQKKFDKSWPNFSIKEIAQRSAGWEKGITPVVIIPDTMDKLQLLRNWCGFPLRITSGYRSPEYNDKVSGTGKDGPHTTGRAFDIACYGESALKVIYFAHKIGFTGIGVKQSGPFPFRFVHVDDLEGHETKGPRPWIWSYK